jgi:hypothetical protein
MMLPFLIRRVIVFNNTVAWLEEQRAKAWKPAP